MGRPISTNIKTFIETYRSSVVAPLVGNDSAVALQLINGLENILTRTPDFFITNEENPASLLAQPINYDELRKLYGKQIVGRLSSFIKYHLPDRMKSETYGDYLTRCRKDPSFPMNQRKWGPGLTKLMLAHLSDIGLQKYIPLQHLQNARKYFGAACIPESLNQSS